MATRPQPRVEGTPVPQEFRDAVTQMRSALMRPEVSCEEMPAPQRIAPYAAALAADVTVEGAEAGTGRIVLLHDPAGNQTWGGTFRCVAYARAELTLDFAEDPMLAEVAWTWLVEALEAHHAGFSAPSGTITKVTSESFGSMAEEESSAQLEVRASWTPHGDLGPHVEAWGELMCMAVGLEPVPEGVTALTPRRASLRPPLPER